MVETIKLNCEDLQEYQKNVLKTHILQTLFFAPKLIDNDQFNKVEFK